MEKVMNEELKKSAIQLLHAVSVSEDENLLRFGKEIEHFADLMIEDNWLGFAQLTFDVSESIAGCAFLFSKEETLSKLITKAKALFNTVKESKDEGFIVFNCIGMLYSIYVFEKLTLKRQEEKAKT